MSIPILRPRLERLGRQLRAVALGRAGGLAVSAVAGSTALLISGDALAPLPGGLRLAGLLGLLLLAGLGIRRLLLAARPIAPEAVARRIEIMEGTTDNALIAACQFEALPKRLSRQESMWLPPALATALATEAAVPRSKLLAMGDLARVLGIAGAVIVAVILASTIWPDHARHGLARLVLPLADLPPLGDAVVTVDPDRDLAVVDGTTMEIRIRTRPVDGRSAPLAAPELRLLPGTDSGTDVTATGDPVALVPAGPGQWTATLAELHHTFTFRVGCAGTVSPARRVTVLPPPRLTLSRFIVDGPAYTGIKAEVRPGPPAPATLLPGAALRLELSLDQPVPALEWRLPDGPRPLVLDHGVWSSSVTPDKIGAYTIAIPGGTSAQIIARGDLRREADHPPEATLGDEDRNRFTDPGERLVLPVAGQDDIGLAELRVEVREAGEGTANSVVRTWTYLGPPGPRQATEPLHLELDPARFHPGQSYLFTAVARDRAPGPGRLGRSAPLVLRIRAVADLKLPAEDPRNAAFGLLRRCLAEQIKARAGSGNFRANLSEIRLHKTFAVQTGAAAKAQGLAQDLGAKAATTFAKINESATLALLRPIVDPGMVQVQAALAGLTDGPATADQVAGVIARQDDFIARLTALLGTLVAESRIKSAPPSVTGTPQQEADRAKAESLKNDLEKFLADQQRILERSRTLADKGGADLTDEEDKIAGELAKSEKEWAKMLEEKLTDFAKNPPQDFSDASQATEGNTVWQDVKLAADALDAKKVTLAVPAEQAGIENAQKLVNNLEKWLSSTPDKTKWEMEDVKNPADVAVAELPKEMEDIVGELLDKAEAMTPDVQDATSAWMDSLDKGAGWTAADGPISNMSAKGITGNVLPNQNEVGGRSGEGRNGRSNGQMVQDEAVGKGGQETPTRLSNTPFEQGSVKDSSKENSGGATGGGKLSGFDVEGLRGPAPPPQLKQAMARLAGKQQALQQQAEQVVTGLRARRLPSGAVESAANALAEASEAAKRFDAPRLRQAQARLLDDLGAARRDLAEATTVRRDRSALGERARKAAAAGAEEPVPAGYEDMAGQYFQALAGER